MQPDVSIFEKIPAFFANLWASLSPASCLPDHCICEPVLDFAANRQPLATVSSLPLLVYGIALAYASMRKKRAAASQWAFISIAMALSSVFFHASYTRLSEFFDFGSIIVAMVWILGQSDPRFRSKTGVVAAPLLILLALFPVLRGVMSGIPTAAALYALARTKNRDAKRAVWVFGASFALFIVDRFKIACTPESLVHGHSLWHLGTALAAYFVARFVQALPERTSSSVASVINGKPAD